MPEFQKKGVVWDDMEVGSVVSTIHFFVTPTDIKMAAELFHDDNALYFSRSFAAGTEWGGIIAPFYFLDSAFRWATFVARAGIKTKCYTINAHGVLESFLPVRPGDQLVGKMYVHEKYVKRDKNFLTWRIEVHNEEGEMVARKFWTSYWTDREILYPKKESFR
jgi:acyl dehydratase